MVPAVVLFSVTRPDCVWPVIRGVKSKIGTGKLLPLSQAGWRTIFSAPTTGAYPEVSTRDGLRSSNAVPNIPHTTSPPK